MSVRLSTVKDKASSIYQYIRSMVADSGFEIVKKIVVVVTEKGELKIKPVVEEEA